MAARLVTTKAQAEFVLWWDTQAEKFKGGDQRNRAVTLLQCHPSISLCFQRCHPSVTLLP